jgi:branched-chain amino acid transport system permease protein
MVYGIAKMLNFAHGDIIMVGGYAMFTTLLMIGHPIPALIVGIIFCVILGVCVERFAYRPLRGASPLAVLITAIGVSSFLQSVAQIVFGTAPKMPTQLQILGSLQIGSLRIAYGTLVTLGVTVVLMSALTVFVKYSKTGRAMVAVSEDRGAAQLMGINTNAIITVTFAIGSALAAVAAYLMLMKAPSLSSTLGAMPGIKAFTAAVIGGIGSIPGAMLGGILLGVVEAFALNVPAIAPFTDAIEFAVLIVILLVKPAGLLGKARREKV